MHVCVSSQHSEERIQGLLSGKCKCTEGRCYGQLRASDVQRFLDQFEQQGKREQDTILCLAVQDAEGNLWSGGKTRREFYFLGFYLKRVCFEALLGISSHRVDRIGLIDLRFGKQMRASQLTASIDSFAMVLYNSVAEPLPHKLPGMP